MQLTIASNEDSKVELRHFFGNLSTYIEEIDSYYSKQLKLLSFYSSFSGYTRLGIRVGKTYCLVATVSQIVFSFYFYLFVGKFKNLLFSGILFLALRLQALASTLESKQSVIATMCNTE